MKDKKKHLIFAFLISIATLVYITCAIYLKDDKTENNDPLHEYQDDYANSLDRNKDIAVTVQEKVLEGYMDSIYSSTYQDKIERGLRYLQTTNEYTEDDPLVVYNPFGTNTQSLYVYFKTKEPCSITYSVHVNNGVYPDFKRDAAEYNNFDGLSHEFVVTGLIPNALNMITLRLTGTDGVTRIRRFYYNNTNNVYASSMSLEKTQGMKDVYDEKTKITSTVVASGDKLSDGMFTVFPCKNEVTPCIRVYDNDGVMRAEIPMEDFTARNLVLGDGEAYLTVSSKKFVKLSKMGKAIVLCDDPDMYSFSGEYCEGVHVTEETVKTSEKSTEAETIVTKNDDILIVATRKRSGTENDVILSISKKDGHITELMDFKLLMPEFYERFSKLEKPEKWLNINSISVSKMDNQQHRIMVTSENTDLMILVRRIYNKPEVLYIVGDRGVLDTTTYLSYYLREGNEIEVPDDTNDLFIAPYDKIRTTRYYLYVLDSNSKYKYERKEPHFAKVKKYMVDEAESVVRLVDTYRVSATVNEGSISIYNNHFIYVPDTEPVFYEYDKNFNLIYSFRFIAPEVKKTEEQREYEEDNPLPDDTVLYNSIRKIDFTNFF